MMYPFNDTDLPLEDRLDDVMGRLTLEEKISLIPTNQQAVERLGINAYQVGGEAAHGIAWVGEATVFPQPIGLACTWNKDLMVRIGDAIGDEARGYYKKLGEKGGLTLWAPTVDMERDPRWGRTEEAYGEDPYLTGEMTTALVSGMQGEDPFYLKMAATLKHFFANNNEERRGEFSASVDPRNMREYYWMAFKPAIEQGKACCIMTAYNAVNGVPCIASSIVKDVVKGQWHLPGFVVSDAADFSQTVTMHRYCEDYAQAAAAAIRNGVDCLTDEPELIKRSVAEALEQGLLSEHDIDAAVRNILRIRFRLGQFDARGGNPYSNISEEAICAPQHAALSLEAAKESIVLLKNDGGMLPLCSSAIDDVAVIGPLADVVYTDWYSGTLPYRVTPLEGIKAKLPGKSVHFEEGCDVIALQDTESGMYVCADTDGTLRVLEKEDVDGAALFDMTDWGWGNFTLKAKANGKYVNAADKIAADKAEIRSWFIDEAFNFELKGDSCYAIRAWNGQYVSTDDDNIVVLANEPHLFNKKVIKDGIAAAKCTAAKAGTVIFFAGNNPYINGKEDHDRPDITLPPAQERMLKEVYKINSNLALAVISSYPVAINWADENVPAILYSSHGGQELGNAVADVLFGGYNPAGRLNMTWYRCAEQLPPITDYDIIKGGRTYMYFEGRPLYPFGHGLSYTEFEYSGLKLSSKMLKDGESIGISVDVKNCGAIDGDEVVQLYIASQRSRVKRPIRELKAFERIHLSAGESKTVRFTLASKDIMFWDVTRHKFCLETGSYDVMIGSSSACVRTSCTIEVKGEKIPPRNLALQTMAEDYDDYYNITLGEGKNKATCVIAGEGQSWIAFKNADVSAQAFHASVAGINADSKIEIRIDSPYGKLIGQWAADDSFSNASWQLVSCNIEKTRGLFDVYLVFNSPIKIEWFNISSLL